MAQSAMAEPPDFKRANRPLLEKDMAPPVRRVRRQGGPHVLISFTPLWATGALADFYR